MTEITLANLGLHGNFASGADGWDEDLNQDLRALDALVNCAVASAPLNVPPGTPSLGDRYIVGTAPTGAWASQANAIAVYTKNEEDTAEWEYYAPKDGWVVTYIPTDSSVQPVDYFFRGGMWTTRQYDDGLTVIMGTASLTGIQTIILSTGLSATASGAGTVTLTSSGSVSGTTELSEDTDVNVTEGAGIDGQFLAWNNTDNKWEPRPITVFGPSGSSHASGLVPDPGDTAGNTKYLREDGTWNVPPGTGGGGGGGGGGSGFGGGPVFGTTTSFSPPEASEFGTILSSTTAGTLALSNVSGGPLVAHLPVQGNGQGLSAAYQSCASSGVTVVALLETTPFVNANNPNPFAAAIVWIGSTSIIAIGFGGSGGVPELQMRQYSLDGLTYTGTYGTIPVSTKTGWFKSVLSTDGTAIAFYFSPNGINWIEIDNFGTGASGAISGVGIGADGYAYYGTWGPPGSPTQFMELDLWEWTLTTP